MSSPLLENLDVPYQLPPGYLSSNIHTGDGQYPPVIWGSRFARRRDTLASLLVCMTRPLRWQTLSA